MHKYTASIIAFTETWLNKNDEDRTLNIDGFATPLGWIRIVTSQENNFAVVCVCT